MNKRYQNINVVKNTDGVRLYTTNIYPAILPTDSDVYLITTEEDRYDLLASKYFGDVTLWWVIPSVNNLPCDTLYPEPGIQLRIPSNLDTVLRSYDSINQS